jgi:hypothetical protein
MPTLHFPTRPLLGTLAAVVLFTSTGCPLPHASLRYSTLTPAEYCPGDTLTAHYDIAGSTPCVSHSGLDCAALAPTMDVTTTSSALPSYSAVAFSDSRTFTPTEDNVSATFRPTPGDPNRFLYPYRDAMGNNRVADRLLKVETRNAKRFVDGTAIELTHGGMCNGSMPTHAPANLPGEPQVSSRLVAQQICNANALPIFVTVTGSGGGNVTGMLAPGGCLPLGMGASGGVVSVSPAGTLPGVRCDALENSAPPPALKTRVVLACGN